MNPSNGAVPKKLWLDDVRPAPRGWDWVKSFERFAAYLGTHPFPEVISFDHDLADEHYAVWQDTKPDETNATFKEKTGYECAKLLVELNKFPAKVYVHSFNPVGAARIAHLLGRHTEVEIRPYTGKEI